MDTGASGGIGHAGCRTATRLTGVGLNQYGVVGFNTISVVAHDQPTTTRVIVTVSDRCGHTLDNRGSMGEHFEFIEGQCLKRRSKAFYPSPPALLQQPGPLCRCFEPHGSGVLGVTLSAYQTRGLQSGNHLRHRRRLDLLDECKFRQPHWTREHEDRQGGQPSRSDPGARILLPDTSQQVDCRRVQGVGDRCRAISACA
jgi:hypothetical protein